MGDYFYYSYYLEVDNCWMVVIKDVFKNEFVNLELIVYNRVLVLIRKIYMVSRFCCIFISFFEIIF